MQKKHFSASGFLFQHSRYCKESACACFRGACLFWHVQILKFVQMRIGFGSVGLFLIVQWFRLRMMLFCLDLFCRPINKSLQRICQKTRLIRCLCHSVKTPLKTKERYSFDRFYYKLEPSLNLACCRWQRLKQRSLRPFSLRPVVKFMMVNALIEPFTYTHTALH